MKKVRTIEFGKYKGQPIILLIATHIGYIMWCLKNINNFYLTDEEQTLYDAVAIYILKYKIDMVFPREDLKQFIKNKKDLDNLNTPLFRHGGMYLDLDRCNAKLRKIYHKYSHILNKRAEPNNTVLIRDSCYTTLKKLTYYEPTNIEDLIDHYDIILNI